MKHKTIFTTLMLCFSQLVSGSYIDTLFSTGAAQSTVLCERADTNTQSAGSASCSSTLQLINLGSFRVTAQASADGVSYGFWGWDAAANLHYRWDVPYVYSRRVLIDPSAETATFPIVNRAFQVEASQMVAIDQNPGGEESAWVGIPNHDVGLAVGGTELDTTVLIADFSRGLDGSEIQTISKIIERPLWDIPTAGESFSLTHLTHMYTGEDLYWDEWKYWETGMPEIFLRGRMGASSNGSLDDVLQAIFLDGGEALACMGKNSALSNFGLRCSGAPDGAVVSALWSIQSYVTVPIEYVGLGDGLHEEIWRIVRSEPVPGPGVPEPTTLTLMSLGLAGIGLAHKNKHT